jgi:fatty-acyl-CoA synthase
MVGAVGQPDAYAGELPVAYVQLREGTTLTEAELVLFAEAHISERAAVPKAIYVIAEMPLTDVRKLAKAELRKDAINRVFGTVLRSALGMHVDIAVVPHDVHGIAVNVMVPAAAERRAEIERLVDEAVRGYSIRAFLHWS